ncbi:glycosyl transferase [Pseudomonas moraviensis]|uniref:MraY family glycosyltransferase n=1 Tax=Pseudomonas moraviensis TaxID=321662 RepID=UPI00135E6A9C|nr:glycosyltransferase family 4 protein [Pseudomonas moraviensis]MXI45250.1 glycosyl transferase [Pseudomonas moraviensis]
MTVWWMLLLVIVVSWGLTFILRRYALAKSLIDIPNERSSHTVPTPRGGGVAIVASFLFALPVLTSLGLLDLASLVGLFGSGLLVAVIGFADDHGHIAARWRLVGHFLAAAWALYWLDGLPAVDFFGVAFDLGLVGNILAVVYLVWMLNLYNFMDGIDGLASAEAISACFAMCVVYWLSGYVELIWLALFLAGAVSGFTYWNIPPARIFMGDAGSGFLGITLGVFVLHAASLASELLWSWIIILGVFIVDSTFTLVRRLVRGEKFYNAHRSHAYQYASRLYKSHSMVTLVVVAVNLLWLLPLACLVGFGKLNGPLGVCLAYAPIVGLVKYFKAGESETSQAIE